MVSEQRGKSDYQKKNLSEQGREPTTNSPKYGVDARIRTRDYIRGDYNRMYFFVYQWMGLYLVGGL